MVKTLSNGRVQIGDYVMAPYTAAVRGIVKDKAELDTFYGKTLWGEQGFSGSDNTFTREVFNPFYGACLTGLKSLENAVDQALLVESIYKPTELVKRQIAVVLPPLICLLKGMFAFVQQIRDRGVLTDNLLALALQPELATGGEQAIIEAMKAQEVRAAFRGLGDDPARSLLLQKRLLKYSDLFTWQALKDSIIPIIPDTLLRPLETGFIQANAPWLFAKKDDDTYLMAEIKSRVQVIQGFISEILRKGGATKTIYYPNTPPWNDGRFFTENLDGFMLRLPQIPESYYGQYPQNPIYWTQRTALFSAKMML